MTETKVMVWQGVKIEYHPKLTSDEVIHIVDGERKLWKEAGKEIAKIVLELEDGDIIKITSTEKSPIRRVRRITGYLSDVENFNDAKQAELSQRYKHM